MGFLDSQEAFNSAINAGFLSDNPQSDVYAGLYMYMYSKDGADFFKHINTREYSSFIRVF